MSAINSQSCSPPEVTTGGIYNESLYCYLLCALIHREEIQVVSSTFAHSILQAFRTFEDVWEKLCNDIREGVLSSKITVPSVRTAVSEILKPDPELADLIHKKVSGLNNWYGLIPELFPNVKYVLSIMTGSMETYVERLRHYAGEVPLVSSDYGASEGSIGTNLHPRAPPELVSYTILPHLAYFEFIPLTENSSEDPKPVGLTEVKVGEEYELVMTTNAGFYRYRMGDVVKITGFYNSTPEFKFIRRRSIILSINIDKNTEHDLHLAVLEASKVLAKEKLYVVDYTSHADISELPGHYVIFFEISGEASEEVLSESCTSLEKHFLIEPGYMTSLKTNNIGPLELRVVRSGTFQKILDHFVGKGISVTQFKTPRCVAATNIILQILNENVEKKYISTALG
ncbi:putative GH3 family protein [Lupinus albus]|uniref:Putative GH3 family protein n=1 Tax=Lupinus albus TaxID=3870 RepID=A0A6A4PWJ0_LUPAL|nr:putative GH3 family protein [Lupinus albus]